MVIYKLATPERTTGRGFAWGPKGWSPPRLDGNGPLRTPHWYHGYESPLLAVLHNPIHANFSAPICFAVEVDEADICRDSQLQLGFRAGVVGDDVPLPAVTAEQRIRYGIGCAWAGATEEWRDWAAWWLSGEDRSVVAASAAEKASLVTARAASAVGDAPWSAAWAEVWATQAAFRSAEAVARAVAWAEEWSMKIVRPIHLPHLAEWAMTDLPIAEAT